MRQKFSAKHQSGEAPGSCWALAPLASFASPTSTSSSTGPATTGRFGDVLGAMPLSISDHFREPAKAVPLPVPLPDRLKFALTTFCQFVCVCVFLAWPLHAWPSCVVSKMHHVQFHTLPWVAKARVWPRSVNACALHLMDMCCFWG